MRLTDLYPKWIYDYAASGSHRRADDLHSIVHHDGDHDDDLPQLSIANVHGVKFLCPTCFKKNNGPIGTESVLCWFAGRGVPDDAFPGPGRWAALGTSFDDLTLSPSVNVDHEHWHGFITNGEVK